MGDCSDNGWDRVNFDHGQRLLEIKSCDQVVSLRADCSLQADGQRLGLREATIEGEADLGSAPRTITPLRFGDPAVNCHLTISRSEDGQTLLLSAEIHNRSDAPVTLGQCRLLDIAEDRGEARLAGDDGQAVYLEFSATTSPTRVQRADSGEVNRSRILLHIVSPGAGRALHLSFPTFDRITTFFEFTYDPSGIKSLAAICDFEGFELAAGESVTSETLVLEAREDYHASLHAWADRAAARYQPLAWPKTPAGWLGWSWVDVFNVERYEEAVIRNLDAIRRRLAGFDIEYVWISIGNIKDGLPGDWLNFDLQNFPHGHEWLVEQLAERGFKLGFWCGAFWMCGALEAKTAEMREGMLKRAGQPAVARPHWEYGAAGLLPPEQRPPIYSLDPTHPKTKAFLHEVFETYRQWGVRYYMIDFLNAVAGSTSGVLYDDYYDKSVSKGPAVLRKGLATVREAAGPDTYLLSSSGPTVYNTGYMNACRVGSDYGEGRALNPDSYFYPATFVINSANFWTSHRYASTNMAGTYFTHRKLYINDSGNVLTLDKPIPVCEAQIVATIFGINGGPVMLGDDIDNITEDRLAMIKKVFPRTPEVAVPVDLFERPLPGYPRVFWQHVAAGWGEWEIVAVINYDDDPLVLPLSLDRFGLDPAGQYRLWEFWNEQYLGVVSGELRAVAPPRSARVYRLAKSTPHPWVLATDMHVQQGRVELAEVRWDESSMTLSGKATRPAGEAGSLYVAAPKGLCVTTPAGNYIAKDATDESLVIRHLLRFGEEPVEFSIGFADVAKGREQSKRDLT